MSGVKGKSGIYERSAEHKEKTRQASLGRTHSEESKRKISESNKGRIVSAETRKKIGLANSISQKGKKMSEESIAKMLKSRDGFKHTEESKRKMSEACKGEKGSNWRGGVSPENKKIRRSIDYRLWRESVFARDNWTCQKCENRGSYLHPHHILNFAQYKELRFAIDNGITFCKKCHMEFHKIYGKENNTQKQVDEFLS